MYKAIGGVNISWLAYAARGWLLKVWLWTSAFLCSHKARIYKKYFIPKIDVCPKPQVTLSQHIGQLEKVPTAIFMFSGSNCSTVLSAMSPKVELYRNRYGGQRNRNLPNINLMTAIETNLQRLLPWKWKFNMFAQTIILLFFRFGRPPYVLPV